MRDVVIVDLDGTLSDGRHRLHLLPKVDLHLTESWSEFNRASVDDTPIQDTIDVINALAEQYEIVILTGRSDEVAGETDDWLYRHGVHYDHLIMRRRSDNRKDTIIKREVLEDIGLERILCAFDDSPQVIRMMRDIGITVYAVTEYAEERADIKSHGVEEL